MPPAWVLHPSPTRCTIDSSHDSRGRRTMTRLIAGAVCTVGLLAGATMVSASVPNPDGTISACVNDATGPRAHRRRDQVRKPRPVHRRGIPEGDGGHLERDGATRSCGAARKSRSRRSGRSTRADRLLQRHARPDHRGQPHWTTARDHRVRVSRWLDRSRTQLQHRLRTGGRRENHARSAVLHLAGLVDAGPQRRSLRLLLRRARAICL